MKYLISIIVPTKNAEKTIIRCLESIKNQTFNDFEVLNIDISEDNTKSLVESFVLDDSRFKYIRANEVGLAKQRNLGIRKAQGEYITFIDGDDTIDPKYLEELYEFLKENNCDISCCNFLRVDSLTDRPINKKDSSKSFVLSNIETLKLLETNRGTQLTLCQGKLLKREFLLNHLINEEILNEDEATTYKWYFDSGKICVLDSQLYNYYIYSNSLSSEHNKKIKEKAIGLCKTYQDRYNLYKISKDKKLIYLGWEKLIDTSLQYAYIFKKNKDKTTKKLLKSYFKKYKCINYLFSHFKTYMVLVLKYLRAI